MKLAPLFILGLLLSTTSPSHAATSQRAVGYVEEWAQYRGGECQFPFGSINANLYTHLIYAFATISGDGNYQVTDMEDGDANNTVAQSYANFQAVKARNPALKTLISIGGASFSTDASTKWIYSSLSADPNARAKFAQSAIAYARNNGFDGIDVDWEYPAWGPNGGWPRDTNNFTSLLTDVRSAITQEAAATGQTPLLLTFAAPATSNDYDNIQLGAVAQQVDWINLMAYDYHGSWDPNTGALAPLMVDAAPDSAADDSHTVQAYLAAGVPSDKIVLGLAGYGRTFAKAAQGAMNTPAGGGGTPGPCTAQSGLLSYGEIMQQQAQDGFSTSWDPISMTPFAYDAKSGTWLTYENELSVQMKLLYVQAQRLGGAMIWSVDSDDVAHGYPLSALIAQYMLGINAGSGGTLTQQNPAGSASAPNSK